MLKKIIIILIIALLLPLEAMAAVGCDLNDPDRDVKRFFPQSTGYRTEYLSLDRMGGEETLAKIESRLGDKFRGMYETIDVPYTVYTILQGEKVIGYMHGVNQKSTYGGMQIFLTFDTAGNVTNFYFQKLTSRAAEKLRANEFARQFVGMTLGNYETSSVKVNNPDKDAEADFISTMRGVKKNLVLSDFFIFNKGK